MSLPLRFVLASASPRRKRLLEGLGLSFEVVKSGVDESPRPDEKAPDQCLRLAQEKAQVVAADQSEALVLGADTAVVVNDLVLGKPEDVSDAQRMLGLISGRWHTVVTAFSLQCPERSIDRSRLVTSEVFIRKLTDQQIRWYIATGEPMDKAGAYAIQGIGASLVAEVKGSYTCVVGLPLAETVEEFEALFGPDCLLGDQKKEH